jgi:isopentenyl diphosphate isomerase/L-lactate dehydrogenase-like FMN-dependent dehydrogenase
VDISARPDLRMQLFGTTWETPIWLCPIGNQAAFYPMGKLVTAKSAKAKATLQVLSTVTDSPIEKVVEAAGNPIWFQLDATSRWDVTQKLVRHAEQAGCPVLVLTVDTQAGRNTETLNRAGGWISGTAQYTTRRQC